MAHLITIREAVAMTGRSKTSLHRDIAAGRLPIAQRIPGYRTPFLLDADTVKEVYRNEHRVNGDRPASQ